VTGAAGCVGHFLVGELLKAGYSVTALDLPGSDFPEDGDRVRRIEADLTRPGVAESAVEGASLIVHAAAWVDIGRSYAELAPVNLEATKRLYEAAAAAGASRFLFFSTGSVYIPGPVARAEDSATRATNDYVRTKLEAEEYLRSRAGGPVVNVIRPALIFGPRGKVLAGALATMPAVFRLVSDHTIGISGGPRSNWVHAQDVARAVVFLIDHPQPHGSVFNVANDDPSPVGDLFTTALRLGGLRMLGVTIPYPTGIVRLAMPLIANTLVLGTVNRLAGELFAHAACRAGIRSPLVPKLDREALAFGVEDMMFDNARLKALGFQYRYPTFEEGWTATQAWYSANRWVP
jgi:nucleoside-diphosphate-sugar epimerase